MHTTAHSTTETLAFVVTAPYHRATTVVTQENVQAVLEQRWQCPYLSCKYSLPSSKGPLHRCIHVSTHIAKSQYRANDAEGCQCGFCGSTRPVCYVKTKQNGKHEVICGRGQQPRNRPRFSASYVNKPETCTICKKAYWSLSREQHYKLYHPDQEPEQQTVVLEELRKTYTKHQNAKIRKGRVQNKHVKAKPPPKPKKRKRTHSSKKSTAPVDINVPVPPAINLNPPPKKKRRGDDL